MQRPRKQARVPSFRAAHAQDIQAALRARYATVYCTAFSPCGQYLAAGSSTGCLSLWHIEPLLTEEGWPSSGSGASTTPLPIYSFPAHDCTIYSLLFVPDSSGSTVLVTGSDEELRMWRFSDILESAAAASSSCSSNKGKQNSSSSPAAAFPSPVHDLLNSYTPPPPSQSTAAGSAPSGGGQRRRRVAAPASEVNDLSLDHTSATTRIIAASGDGSALVWDVKTGLVVRSLTGGGQQAIKHGPAPPTASMLKQLHCVCSTQSGLVLGGGEDESVQIWDARASYSVVGSLNARLALGGRQPKQGGVGGGGGGSTSRTGTDSNVHCFVSSVDADVTHGNWAVFGGGSSAVSVWHLPSRSMMSSTRDNNNQQITQQSRQQQQAAGGASGAAPPEAAASAGVCTAARSGVHSVVKFYGDGSPDLNGNVVLAAGAQPHLDCFNKNGDLLGSIQTNMPSVCSMAINTCESSKHYGVFAISGASQYIDVHLDRAACAFSLSC